MMSLSYRQLVYTFAIVCLLPLLQCTMHANVAYMKLVGAVDGSQGGEIRWYGYSSLTDSCFETGVSLSRLQQVWVDLSVVHSMSGVSILGTDLSSLNNSMVTFSAHNSTRGGRVVTCYNGTIEINNASASMSPSNKRISIPCYHSVNARYISIAINRPTDVDLNEVIVHGRVGCSKVRNPPHSAVSAYVQGQRIHRCLPEYQMYSLRSLELCDRPGEAQLDRCQFENLEHSINKEDVCDHWGLWSDQVELCSTLNFHFNPAWGKPTHVTWAGCEKFVTPSGSGNIFYPQNETWWGLSTWCGGQAPMFQAPPGHPACTAFYEVDLHYSYMLSNVHLYTDDKNPIFPISSCSDISVAVGNTVCSADYGDCRKPRLDFTCTPQTPTRTLKVTVDLTSLNAGSKFSMSHIYVAVRHACGNPPAAEHASLVHNLVSGGQASYWCDDGYARVSGDYNLTCDSNGTWEGSLLACVPACDDPLVNINAELLTSTSNSSLERPWLPGSVVVHGCTEGFERVSGDARRTCQADLTWSGTELVCAQKDVTTGKGRPLEEGRPAMSSPTFKTYETSSKGMQQTDEREVSAVSTDIQDAITRGIADETVSSEGVSLAKREDSTTEAEGVTAVSDTASTQEDDSSGLTTAIALLAAVGTVVGIALVLAAACL